MQHIKLLAIKKCKTLRRNLFELVGSDRYSRASLGLLHEKLMYYIDKRSGFFIEVGANNGFTQSNTYYLEKFRNWKGILIEPIPELYSKCKKLRKKSDVYNYALVAEDYPNSTIKMHYANLMSLVEGAYNNPLEETRHINEGIACQKLKKTYSVDVPAKTLNSILGEYNLSEPIDFFSLDVEGYELEVLKGLDLNKYKPEYICLEAKNNLNVIEYLSPYYDVIEQLSVNDSLLHRKNQK